MGPFSITRPSRVATAKAQAPRWLQDAGFEWLFRLCCEPRRLWRRYLYHNPRFLFHFARQLASRDQPVQQVELR